MNYLPLNCYVHKDYFIPDAKLPPTCTRTCRAETPTLNEAMKYVARLSLLPEVLGSNFGKSNANSHIEKLDITNVRPTH